MNRSPLQSAVAPARIVFFGTPEFAVPSLRALVAAGLAPVAVVTQTAKPVGRHAVTKPSAVAVAARELKLPVVEPASIKKPEFVEWLTAQKPDVAVLVAYGKILPDAVLAIPRLGFVNVHPSLLPKHRGASPIAGTILAGDAQTGVTIMQLDAEMDHGPVLAQETAEVPADATMGSLSETLSHLSAKLLVKTLPQYLDGAIKPQPQKHDQATVTKLLSRADGEINWTKPSALIDRMIRAYHPWPGTFTCLNDKRVKIIAARVAQQAQSTGALAQPGALRMQADQLFIRTGDSWLEILRLQLEGKKVQTAADFVRGHQGLQSAIVGPCRPQK